MKRQSLKRAAAAGFAVGMFAASASAQVTPAAGYTPPDDTPSIRVGITLYPAYVYQTEPTIKDGNGNTVHKSAFDVQRAYINVTGNISHLISFRITPDVVRESGLVTLSAPDVVSNDSLVYRIKYAFAQLNLDDWMTKGSWVRFGIHQTPWVEFDEQIYRYRFQGTTFIERQALPTVMASADAGVSFHYNFPSNFGDTHFGIYNGENYGKAEVNGHKGFEFRGTVRPFATMAPVLRGIRGHFVYYNDAYNSGNPRRRTIGTVTFEHQYISAEYYYLSATDQTLTAAPKVDANGWATWVIPRYPLKNNASIELLLRYDHFTPNTSNAIVPAAASPFPGSTVFDDQKQNRSIIGIAYWFPHQGNVATAFMVDYDGQSFDKIIATKPIKIVSVHGLLQF